MSKHKKKNRDPWVAFINRMLNRKRAKREFKIPSDYIMSVADQLHRTNPSKDIIYNTLVGFYEVAFEKGYVRKGDDITWFKAKQKAKLDQEFGQFLDYLDDISRDKSGIKLSFAEWKDNQQKLNQNKK